MVNRQPFSKLELMQGRVEFVPNGWRFMHTEKAFNIRNNLRLPINGADREANPGPYPYYGPTRIQGYIGSYEQDGDFVLIGEDGDHFLKYKNMPMTQLVEGRCTVNNHAHILEDTDEAIREWFYYYFMHRDIFSFLTRQGAGRFKLNKAALAKLPVLIPPVPEQKKIAKILSTWDKAITITEQLIANSQQQKKALMQQLLTGKKRLTGFSGEWEEVRLGDIAEINSGGTPKSSVTSYYDGSIPWVSIADMTNYGKIINRTKRNITQLGLDNSSARLYPKGTVLYAMYASIGECSIAGIELSSSQAILGIRPENTLDKFYLYFYLSSLKEKIKLLGQQGAQSNLNAGMVKGFRFTLPPVEEQQKIAQALSSADQEIETLQQKLNFLKQEKKSLMQQLLTGKRRVVIDVDSRLSKGIAYG